MKKLIVLAVLVHATGFADDACTKDAEILASRIDRVTLEKEALATRDVYERYFGAIRKTVLEGDYMIDIAEIALLSKEHLLMVGPPGTAKTMVADLVLGNMAERSVNGNGSARSFFSIQMTPETTISETHGPFNYQKLTQEGVYERMLHEGMILYRNVFIDEIFDSRANALRNILQALNERRHTQGTRHTDGKIEVTFAATNFYQSQVYEKAGNDGPKAVLDRFAMVAFVPDEFQHMNSYVELIQRAKKDKPQIPTLHFDEIEKIRALVPLVEIPDHVAEFLANLSLRMKRETKNIEQASLKRHKEALQDGEDPIPPYRSTKYHSKRTLQKAAAILKSIVVKDWIQQNGQRELIASFGDIEKLEQFFCMNGPKDDFILQLQNASTDPHERAQMDTILNERKIFRKYYQEILNETNSVVAQERLVELHAKLDAPRTEAETATLAVELTQMLQNSLDPDAIGGERIGHQMVRQFVEENLNKVFTEEEAQSIKSAAEESPEKLSETLDTIQAKYRPAVSVGEVPQPKNVDDEVSSVEEGEKDVQAGPIETRPDGTQYREVTYVVEVPVVETKTRVTNGRVDSYEVTRMVKEERTRIEEVGVRLHPFLSASTEMPDRITYSPHGNLYATKVRDRLINVTRATSGSRSNSTSITIEPEMGPVQRIRVSADDKIAVEVAGAEQDSIRVYQVENQGDLYLPIIISLMLTKGTLKNGDFFVSPDNTLTVLSPAAKRIYVFDLTTHKVLRQGHLHLDPIDSVVVNGDTAYVASGGDIHKISLRADKFAQAEVLPTQHSPNPHLIGASHDFLYYQENHVDDGSIVRIPLNEPYANREFVVRATARNGTLTPDHRLIYFEEVGTHYEAREHHVENEP